MPTLTAPVPVSIAQLINNHVRLIEQRDRLLEALERISQHAYDDDTEQAEICADFDNMRRIAHEAIQSAR